MEKQKHYFYGHEISDYGVKNGYVDYRTLASCFDCILNNDIMGKTYNIGYWEQVNGFIDNSEKINENENKINILEDVKDWLKNRYETATETNKQIIDKLIDEEGKEKLRIRFDSDTLDLDDFGYSDF